MKKSLFITLILFALISCNGKKKNIQVQQTQNENNSVTTDESISTQNENPLPPNDYLTKEFVVDGTVYTVKVEKDSEYNCVYDENGKRIDINGSVPIDDAYYEYDEEGKKIYQKDKDGTESRYEYDSDGNLLKIINDICTIYYENNRVSKISYNSGREDIYEYDEEGRLTDDGDCNRYHYNKEGKLIRHDWRSDSIYYEYDDKGNKIHYKYYWNGEDLTDEKWYENEYDSDGKIIKVVVYSVVN